MSEGVFSTWQLPNHNPNSPYVLLLWDQSVSEELQIHVSGRRDYTSGHGEIQGSQDNSAGKQLGLTQGGSAEIKAANPLEHGRSPYI